MEEWVGTLANRNAADDRTRYQRHIKAAFEDMLVRDAQEIGPVMTWIDRQRTAGELSEASIRHNMNLLSRFFSWALERGFAKVNPSARSRSASARRRRRSATSPGSTTTRRSSR